MHAPQSLAHAPGGKGRGSRCIRTSMRRFHSHDILFEVGSLYQASGYGVPDFELRAWRWKRVPSDDQDLPGNSTAPTQKIEETEYALTSFMAA